MMMQKIMFWSVFDSLGSESKGEVFLYWIAIRTLRRILEKCIVRENCLIDWKRMVPLCIVTAGINGRYHSLNSFPSLSFFVS